MELVEKSIGKMKCFGDSMLPVIKSGSVLTFVKKDKYEVGDIVFCKIKGSYIDAHRIIATNDIRGYQIANNKGHVNGWAKKAHVYGKVIQASKDDRIYYGEGAGE